MLVLAVGSRLITRKLSTELTSNSKKAQERDRLDLH